MSEQPDLISQPLLAPIAPGELIDKISILEIKCERIADRAKLDNVRLELQVLSAVRETLPRPPALDALSAELKSVNEKLWDVEDALRECERRQEFGSQFVELARSVYRHNDRRAEIKREINLLLGSRLIEEKAYARY